jgi:hypothetical protein
MESIQTVVVALDLAFACNPAPHQAPDSIAARIFVTHLENHPPDASQNIDLSSQLKEKERLKSPRLSTRHARSTCVTTSGPQSPGPFLGDM